MEISFEPEEIEATREVARRWYEAQPDEFKSEKDFVEPGDSPMVKLILDGEYWKAGK